MNEKIQSRKHRVAVIFIAAVVIALAALVNNYHQPKSVKPNPSNQISSSSNNSNLASAALKKLAVKGRAPMTGYSRQQYGEGWADEGSCNMRDEILARDLTSVQYKSHTCEVESGTLADPYTGKTIHFARGPGTSTAVQIDHVVALGDTWQTGAQQLSSSTRQQLYNDPLELIAVDGPANEQKSDGDAATWLPSNKPYRCRYVARQIAVKTKYHLWITPAEHDAMENILGTCPSQTLPVVTN